LAGVHGEQAVEEDEQADQRGGDQHAGVPAQPGEVQTDLLPKVPPAGGPIDRIHTSTSEYVYSNDSSTYIYYEYLYILWSDGKGGG